MSTVAKLKLERTRGWLSFGLAVLLFISPWVLGFNGETAAAWTAWLTTIVIALVTGAEFFQSARWGEWANLVLGIWLIAAPWIVGFASDRTAQWTHIVLGVLLAALSAWDVWSFRPHTPARQTK